MRRTHVPLATVLFVLALALATPGGAQRLEPTLTGLRQPVAATALGGRLYVAEQAGVIRVVEGGALAPDPFLDIRDLVRSGGERGLLGLAFPPDYAASGRFYVYFTDTNGTGTLARYRRSADPVRADPGSARVLMTVRQPYANHNGGQLAFGPDGLLYWGLGDGGSGGDPQGNGQSPATLLGSILRLDVSGDGAEPAPGNPFLNNPAGRPEVWAFGLRNPWRFSFDRATGDLYIADVGQNAFEEIDMQPAGTPGGVNYGWNVMEGDHCYRPARDCDRSGLTLPIVSYPHDRAWGNSVTGGYVYRGTALAQFRGAYLFSDFGSGRLWAARRGEGGSWGVEHVLDSGVNVSSMAETEGGELLVLDYGGGRLLELVP
jgi:glucose/arabinose dehydrogenase